MTFAWQGFQFEHPEDWAPTHLSGGRDEGYVRIASPEVFSYQVRWKVLRKSDLRRSLDDYLSRLGRDAKKLRVRFSSSVEPIGETLEYRWTGAGNGRGKLATIGERTFFIEASSTTNRSSQGAFQQLDASFAVSGGERELWSVLGLAVQLRSGMQFERHLFQSGRTRIEWKDRLGKVVAERWGFGEQILAKHTFEDWARQSMEMVKSNVATASCGLTLELSKPFQMVFGLAKFDSAANQLVTLKTISRSAKGRPEWDWLI